MKISLGTKTNESVLYYLNFIQMKFSEPKFSGFNANLEKVTLTTNSHNLNAKFLEWVHYDFTFASWTTFRLSPNLETLSCLD